MRAHCVPLPAPGPPVARRPPSSDVDRRPFSDPASGQVAWRVLRKDRLPSTNTTVVSFLSKSGLAAVCAVEFSCERASGRAPEVDELDWHLA